MPKSLAKRLYALGAIIGRGPLERTPIIDLATYLDPIPVANIHDVVRPFEVRARLRKKGSAATQSIWRGISTPADAFDAIDAWMDAIDAAGGPPTGDSVAAAKPASAKDRCIVGTVGAAIELPDGIVLPTGITLQLLPGLLGPMPVFSLPLGAYVSATQEVGKGACDLAFPAKAEPRLVAGESLADDVLKCTRKPVDPADYDVALSAGAARRDPGDLPGRGLRLLAAGDRRAGEGEALSDDRRREAAPDRAPALDDGAVPLELGQPGVGGRRLGVKPTRYPPGEP